MTLLAALVSFLQTAFGAAEATVASSLLKLGALAVVALLASLASFGVIMTPLLHFFGIGWLDSALVVLLASVVSSGLLIVSHYVADALTAIGTNA